jgi:mono/diheme cytochrome c family protein
MRNLFLLLFSVILFSCAENNPTTPDGKPDGKALYEQNCSICHGDDGKLGSAGAKDLSISTMTLEQRMAIILNGKGGMAPFGDDMINEEQRKAIAEYLDTFLK